MSASPLLACSPLALLVAALATGCVVHIPVGNGDDAGSTSDCTDDDATSVGSSTSLGGTGLVSSDDSQPTDGGAKYDLDGPGNATGSDTENETNDTVVPVDYGDPSSSCDPWEQDCGAGEKCMPFANDGGDVWNDVHCVPVVQFPDQAGDVCTVESPGTSGVDTCALGLMCWDVDPETLQGHCVPLCQGSADAPLCEDPTTACAIGNDGVLILCLPLCDPELQDCDEGQSCYPIGDQFFCSPSGSSLGAVGEPCEDIAQCDPGLWCAAEQYVPDCDGLGCCSPFCDVTDPAPPCLPGQVCTPWYEPGTAPEGYEHVGACVLPT